MRTAANIQLPFFAYGLFKPGQLCFFRIRELVAKKEDAWIEGFLKERDAIPLLVPSDYSKVKGVLIYFEKGKEAEAYNRIIDIEPDRVYRWEEIVLENNTRTNLLLGKKPDRCSSYLEGFVEWDGSTDLFFKDAFEEIETILKNNSDFSGDYKSLFRLQMAYTLLWSGLERYAGLRYHIGKKKVNVKVSQIAKEEAFAERLKKHARNNRFVYDSAGLEKCTLDPNNPDKSLKYYYTVRSNAVDRGKAVIRDFDILKTSLEKLLAIFKDLLNDAFDE